MPLRLDVCVNPSSTDTFSLTLQWLSENRQNKDEIRGQKTKKLHKQPIKSSLVLPLGDIIQPETRQDGLPNCSRSQLFPNLKGAMYLTQTEQKRALMIQVFSQHHQDPQYVESIHRIEEELEQWKQSM